MFTRGVGIGGRVIRNCGCAAARRHPSSSIQATRAFARRRFTSSATAAHDAAVSPITHPLAGVASQLDQVAPRFEIDPAQIQILDSPTVFYETLKVRLSSWSGIGSRFPRDVPANV